MKPRLHPKSTSSLSLRALRFARNDCEYVFQQAGRTIILCIALFLLPYPAAGEEKEVIKYVKSWGIKGSEPGRFNEPYDIAVDGEGYVYVTDARNARVQKFDGDGGFVLAWGKNGEGDGEFLKPTGITVDEAGYVYVTDYDADRVQKFDSDGRFILKWGKNGSGDGEFDSPSGIATAPNGEVYVVELYNHRVQRFDERGKFVSKWGKKGKVDNVRSILNFIFPEDKRGEFYYPAKIAAKDGKIYVSDSYNNRVQIFSTEGKYISRFGGMGFWRGGFRVSSGITLDSVGRIYVADFYNNRVQVFDGKGKVITSFGGEGIGAGEFRGPTGVAANEGGEIFVTDWRNHRVQKFKLSD